MKIDTDQDYLYKCMVKGMLSNKDYSVMVTTQFKPEYFENDVVCEIYDKISQHVNKYNNIPQSELIINSVDKDYTDKVKTFMKTVEDSNFDPTENYEWLKKNSNVLLKDAAIKNAIMDSVDVVEEKGNYIKIRSIIEEALCKDLEIDLGTAYFDDIGERLKRIFTATDTKIPTGYPFLDEVTNGGFPSYSFSAFIGKIHSGKSLIMANIIARQVLMGNDVVLFTLEMGEDDFCQRFDSIYSGLDTNRMYYNTKLKPQLIKELQKVKSTENRGEIYVKEFATGEASVNTFKTYLRELEMRGVKPKICFCDYVNLMKPEDVSKGMYEDVKKIVVNLRGMSLSSELPIVSVSQLNREGTNIDLKSASYNHISESMGLGATADFLAILGQDIDSLTYQSELHYAILKNRFGGRIGDIGKMFMDKRSLKLYDESEMKQWLDDAKKSNDSRELYTGE